MRIRKEIIFNIVLILIYFGGFTLLFINKVAQKKIAYEFLEKRPQISDLSECKNENRLLKLNENLTEIKKLCQQLSISNEDINERILLIENGIENKVVDNMESELKSLLDDIYKPLDKKMENSNLFLFGYIALMPLMFRIFRKRINKNNAQHLSI